MHYNTKNIEYQHSSTDAITNENTTISDIISLTGLGTLEFSTHKAFFLQFFLNCQNIKVFFFDFISILSSMCEICDVDYLEKTVYTVRMKGGVCYAEH